MSFASAFVAIILGMQSHQQQATLKQNIKIPELGEAKPGGFQTGAPGFPLFSGKVRIVSRTLRDCSSLVLLIGRERGKEQIGKIPGESPDKSGENPGKIGKVQKGQKGQKGRTSPDHEAPPFETPPLSGP